MESGSEATTPAADIDTTFPGADVGDGDNMLVVFKHSILFNSNHFNSATPETKKRGCGRPPKGPTEGIAVSEDTLSLDGSDRAKKRWQKYRAMSPTSASVERAKTADRVRKSQELKKLRASATYQEASPEDRQAMDDITTQALEEHRRNKGQLATEKHPEELYNSVDEFVIQDNDSSDADADEDESNDEYDFNGSDTDSVNADALPEDSAGSDADDEESGDEDSASRADVDWVVEHLDTERAEELGEDDEAENDENDVANEADVQETYKKRKEALQGLDEKFSSVAVRDILENQYKAAAERFESTQKAKDKVIMEERRQRLEDWEKDPNGPEMGK